MKKLLIFAVIVLLITAVSVWADDTLVVERQYKGADMYSYNFTKKTPGGPGRRVCGEIHTLNHPFANDLLAIPGVEWVIIKHYSIKITKAEAKAFELSKIEEGVIRLLRKYLRAKDVIIVDKER